MGSLLDYVKGNVKEWWNPQPREGEKPAEYAARCADQHRRTLRQIKVLTLTIGAIVVVMAWGNMLAYLITN